jgi:serine/threonine protein kinase
MPPLNNTRRRSRSVGRRNRFNKTNRHNRRSKSAEPYKNINAEKIGEGGFGVVSRPPARCAHFFSQNSNTVNQRNINSIVFQETYYKNPNYVSKLTEMNDAQKELEIGELVKDNIRFWRDYYCFIEFICGAPSEKHIRTGINDYQDTYAIAPYCGVPLEDIINHKYFISPKEACKLLDALRRLIVGISDLHHIQVYHQDIHSGNILFDSKDDHLRLIDFGLALDLYDKMKAAGDNWMSNKAILNAKFQDTEKLLFDIIQPTLEFIEHKLETAENISNASRKCLNEVTQFLNNIPKRVRNSDYPSGYGSSYYNFITKKNDEYVSYINYVLGYNNNNNRNNN